MECRLLQALLKGIWGKNHQSSPCFKADLPLVPFMCRSSCPWYCVVQLPGCGMVPGSTRERDLPSPRCQHHRGFAYGSFKQQWLEAILEQLHVHGRVLKFLVAPEAPMAVGDVGSAISQRLLLPRDPHLPWVVACRASECHGSSCCQVCPAQPVWGWQGLGPPAKVLEGQVWEW